MAEKVPENIEKGQDIHHSIDADEIIQSSPKHMSRALIASFLRVYGLIPFSLLITWIVARNLPQDLWGIYIYSIVLVNGSSIILNFLPPSIRQVIIYKVPELMVLGHSNKVKGLIRYATLVKLFVSVIIFIIYLIFGIILLNNSSDNYTKLKAISVIIYSPNIILNPIIFLYSTLFNALKNFKINLYIVLIEKVTNILGYSVIFYLISASLETKMLYMLGLNISTLIITLIILVIMYKKRFKNIITERINRKSIKEFVTFGLYYSLSSSLINIQSQIYYGILEGTGIEELKTQYNTALNISGQVLVTLNLPIGPVLTDLEKINKHKEMVQLFKKSLQFTNLILAFLSGLLYYFVIIYILLLYPPEYLEIVHLIRDFMLIMFFSNIINNYMGLYSITKSERELMFLNIIRFGIESIFTFISFLLFGFYGFLIGQVFGTGLSAILFWFYGYAINKKYKFSFFSIFKNFFALISVILLVNLIVSNLMIIFSFQSWASSISYFINNMISIGDISFQISIILESLVYISSYSVLFIAYIVFFKAFTKRDLDAISRLGIKIPFKKYIRKILR